MITKQTLLLTIKLYTVPTVVSSDYLPGYLSIHIVILDVNYLAFSTFPASCSEVYAKLQYSLTKVVLIGCNKKYILHPILNSSSCAGFAAYRLHITVLVY